MARSMKIEKPKKEKAPKAEKVKKVKVAIPQLPKHSSEMQGQEIEDFLTLHGHLGEGIERPEDTAAYLALCVEDGTFKEGKKTPKAKLPKPAKEAPTYDWKDKSNLEGRQCFPPCGTSTLLRETTDGNHFEVSRKSDGRIFVVKSKSTRFKAVNERFRDIYIKEPNIRTASGAVSLHCGSQVSESLLGFGVEALRSVASENGLVDRFNGWEAKGLNNGYLRMNLGNILIARAKRNEAVVIDGEGDLAIAAQKGRNRAKAEAEAKAKVKAEEKSAKADELAKKKEAKAAAKAEAEAKKATKEITKAPKKEKVKLEVKSPKSASKAA